MIFQYESTAGYTNSSQFYVQEIDTFKKWVAPKRWDNKAFFNLPLFMQRRELNVLILNQLYRVTPKIKRIIPPRRAYCEGIRFAMCSTRVI